MKQEKAPSKPGFFNKLFGMSSVPAPQNATLSASKAKVQKKEQKKEQIDSDEDEMEFKNYLMEKNDEF